MNPTRFVLSWPILAIVLAGLTAGGCGSGEVPASGPASGSVVNGVAQIDDAAIVAGKRAMHDPRGAARAAKLARAKSKRAQPAPG